MSAQMEVAATDAPQQSDDGLCHTVCCRDDNRSLCGLDVSTEPWDESPMWCLVCEDLIRTGHCPNHGRCIGEEAS